MKEKMSVVKVLKSIISGDILLVMGVHRLFPYILYAFILGWVSIWMSYKAEQTMTLVEANKKELETLKIHHAQKTCEYVGLDRISTIEEMLTEKGSEVRAPEKPADIIKK
ncbi:MAG: hypothetical protein IKA34_04720 [Bacteroidales bacterium]|nr:hypothetical protein [Bacteroidales bacterium]MBO5074136.1 hypothetical protein [Bacteroidales bacterium]MBQ8573407.1 hypothetical protein [Bacteroidales bacterium]MBR1959857.1 hypothetical protein [Bacteroidales bacterium]